MSLFRATVIGSFVLATLLPAGATRAGPLHDAARNSDELEIQRLLNAGTDIDERDESGATALMAAASASHNKTMEYLLQRRADYALRDDRGMTVLHAAAAAGDAEAVAYFVGSDGPGYWPIDINDHDNKRQATPLMVAAESNHGNVVAYLAFGGADIEIPESRGFTALTRAGQEGHDKVVTILLRSGALCQEIDAAWHAECTKRRVAMGL